MVLLFSAVMAKKKVKRASHATPAKMSKLFAEFTKLFDEHKSTGSRTFRAAVRLSKKKVLGSTRV